MSDVARVPAAIAACGRREVEGRFFNNYETYALEALIYWHVERGTARERVEAALEVRFGVDAIEELPAAAFDAVVAFMVDDGVMW